MLPQMHVIFQNTVISCGCAETRDSRGPWAHAHGAGTCSERGLRSPFRARHVSTPSTHIDHLFDFVPCCVPHSICSRYLKNRTPPHTSHTRARSASLTLRDLCTLCSLGPSRPAATHNLQNAKLVSSPPATSASPALVGSGLTAKVLWNDPRYSTPHSFRSMSRTSVRTSPAKHLTTRHLHGPCQSSMLRRSARVHAHGRKRTACPHFLLPKNPVFFCSLGGGVGGPNALLWLGVGGTSVERILLGVPAGDGVGPAFAEYTLDLPSRWSSMS